MPRPPARELEPSGTRVRVEGLVAEILEEDRGTVGPIVTFPVTGGGSIGVLVAMPARPVNVGDRMELEGIVTRAAEGSLEVQIPNRDGQRQSMTLDRARAKVARL